MMKFFTIWQCQGEQIIYLRFLDQGTILKNFFCNINGKFFFYQPEVPIKYCDCAKKKLVKIRVYIIR